MNFAYYFVKSCVRSGEAYYYSLIINNLFCTREAKKVSCKHSSFFLLPFSYFLTVFNGKTKFSIFVQLGIQQGPNRNINPF